MFNRRGEAVTTIAVVFWAVAGVMSVNAIVHRDTFIIKKSISKCVEDGEVRSVCTDKIMAMTQDERIETIRDK